MWCVIRAYSREVTQRDALALYTFEMLVRYVKGLVIDYLQTAIGSKAGLAAKKNSIDFKTYFCKCSGFVSLRHGCHSQ